MQIFSLCDGWEFTERWTEDFAAFRGEAEPVRIPHNVRELPLHYAGPEDYEMVCGYRRLVAIDGRPAHAFLRFDGAAHIATVYINGAERLTHRCGYTAFRVELTAEEIACGSVDVTVRLDCTENTAIPPFGFVVDYLTYGGLNREVWLETAASSYIADAFILTPTLTELTVRPQVVGVQPGQMLRLTVCAPDGDECFRGDFPADAQELQAQVPDALPWDCEHPRLYTCRLTLLSGDKVTDEWSHSFGFRTAAFRADGFYLNGKRVFLRGLNRHQSFPYIGYAAPENLQREDARILKQELGCNAVRTSHYPQSHYFLDECDRLGLLVITEIPGWQHVGSESWQAVACDNTREMVEQYRNHTSIILWGVRINESVDFDEFYTRTNAIAHSLDPTRATTGVRYLEKSHLLEDVYAYNDFSHTGHNPGVKPKKAVTPDMNKAYFVSECNGHMYPTKSGDPWAQRQEQALRHARALSDAAESGEHAGCFGWCMFDYQTHRDFGAGDRICYHGVMDMFRNPKTAAAVYASQQDERPVLELGSNMDIGDYAGGDIGTVYVFTNADSVRLYKNDDFVTELRPTEFGCLPHPPIAVDDTIGALLETKEGYSKSEAALLRKCLLSAKKHGLAGMPLSDKLRMLYAMARYGLKMEDGVALYGKYVGNWGGQATRWRFDAIRDGKVVASATRGAEKELRLAVTTSSTVLAERQSYDMAAVRVRITTVGGAPAPYAVLPVRFTLEGAAELVGPDTVCSEGGMCGTYVRTVGIPGEAVLTVSAKGLESVKVQFIVTSGQ